MMMTFNLTREPWIPVEALDGSVSDVSTREVLGGHTNCERSPIRRRWWLRP